MRAIWFFVFGWCEVEAKILVQKFTRIVGCHKKQRKGVSDGQRSKFHYLYPRRKG